MDEVFERFINHLDETVQALSSAVVFQTAAKHISWALLSKQKTFLFTFELSGTLDGGPANFLVAKYT